jgi:hypothetical protein
VDGLRSRRTISGCGIWLYWAAAGLTGRDRDLRGSGRSDLWTSLPRASGLIAGDLIAPDLIAPDLIAPDLIAPDLIATGKHALSIGKIVTSLQAGLIARRSLSRHRGTSNRPNGAADFGPSAAANRRAETRAQSRTDRRCAKLLEVCHGRAAVDFTGGELFACRLILREYLERLAGRRHDMGRGAHGRGRAAVHQSGGKQAHCDWHARHKSLLLQ